MPKRSVYIFIFIFSSLVALVMGLWISNDPNVFVSYLLIGFWAIITLRILSKIKKLRELHSPHNTIGLLLGTLIVGTCYALWNDYNGIFPTTPFQIHVFDIPYWGLIFALPYILYGNVILYKAFRKYVFVYAGTKALNAKLVAAFSAIIIVASNILYLLDSRDIIELAFTGQISRVTNDFNYISLFACILSGLIFIFSILRKKGRNYSSRTYDSVASRLDRIDEDLNRSQRISQDTRENERNAREQRRRQKELERRQEEQRGKDLERRKREERDRRQREQAKKKRKKQRVTHEQESSKKTKKKVDPEKLKKYYESLKPRSGTLSDDDFKCIFCFELPHISEDGKRDIVLCPSCNYPAHIEEFSEWVLASNLCSRCGSELPASFRRNPRRVKSKRYLAAVKYLLKKYK